METSLYFIIDFYLIPVRTEIEYRKEKILIQNRLAPGILKNIRKDLLT